MVRAAVRRLRAEVDRGGEVKGEVEMLDKATLEFAADRTKARAEAERVMRDNARREGRQDIATMHGDRAAAFDEAADAIRALS
jgi:hypothetical protein